MDTTFIRNTCLKSGFSKLQILSNTEFDSNSGILYQDKRYHYLRDLHEYIKGRKAVSKNKNKTDKNNKIKFFDKSYRILKLNYDEWNQIKNECDIIANLWNRHGRKSNENQFLPEDIVGLILKYVFNESIDCLIGKNEYNSNNYLFVSHWKKNNIWMVVTFYINKAVGRNPKKFATYRQAFIAMNDKIWSKDNLLKHWSWK
eukprot:424498_1